MNETTNQTFSRLALVTQLLAATQQDLDRIAVEYQLQIEELRKENQQLKDQLRAAQPGLDDTDLGKIQ